uniref:Uncharacterized protein n=1 Tax=Megaviridae environmental sample TaxID=1737588 RepID=A0A5J6VKB9_9VIRU|nr:MAG: hypothetical protein [Megaviridae environmental sample]
MGKINYDYIKDIFNNKISLSKSKEKEELSKYNEYIPMYDIYSENIYPINKSNLYYRLIDCHYRFITSEVKQWIENKHKKNKKYHKLLKIISNYDLNILEKTSYETLYKFSPNLGLSISICKRNSFYPYSKHLKPYYSKNELIKLGLNNNIIKNIENTNLSDKKLHYEICKKVSNNDVSSDLIHNSMKFIIDNNLVSWTCFYSLTGSYLYNNYLRGINNNLPNLFGENLIKYMKVIKSNSKLDKDYYLYRFIVDDKFIKNIKVGDHYIEKGLLSTTRDPFYSPAMNFDFGLILLKINIPKRFSDIGLFIENFSLFPKEQEFLLSPYLKLKLISRDDNFKYFHVNKEFEKLIKTKYEFTIVEKLDIPRLRFIEDDIPTLNLIDLELEGDSRVTLFELFLNMCDSNYQFKYNNKVYNCEWFDSTSVYKNLFHNNTKDGILITHYIDNYPVICIECGKDLCVNYLKQYYYYDRFMTLKLSDLIQFVAMISKIFKYPTSKIYFDYKNFVEFKKNYSNDIQKLYLHNNLYCENIYLYLKDKRNIFDSKFFKYEYGYFNLDKLGKENIPKKILNLLPDTFKVKTWKDLIVKSVEEKFYIYKKVEKWCNTYNNNVFKKNYVIFDCNMYLRYNDFNVIDVPDFKFNNTEDRNNYNLIYRLNTRRI